jgi:acetoin utilization protein AcuC
VNPTVAYLYHPDVLHYRFSDGHPFDQRRLLSTHALLRSAGALDDAQLILPAPIADELILQVHTQEYVSAVKALSVEHPKLLDIEEAERFGLSNGEGDTPYFPGMHDATKAIAAGTVSAADLVMSGRLRHALHLGGGLHHALANKAAGFCVYNDASIAITHIWKQYGARVLYIDTDVHHGDGVQATFYADPDICTFSIHETGKYLFPGTGFANERGVDAGFGYSFNLPVEPYTEDESWLSNFRDAVERITAFFKPDVIISQHGCDAHYYDPLSHQHCSMEIYLHMPRIIKQLADTWCEGRWIALGGGGYDIWRVVPRAWSLLWLVMSEHPLAEQLLTANLPLPEDWLATYGSQSPDPLPAYWLDDKNAWEAIPRRQEITDKNIHNKELSLLYLPK